MFGKSANKRIREQFLQKIVEENLEASKRLQSSPKVSETQNEGGVKIEEAEGDGDIYTYWQTWEQTRTEQHDERHQHRNEVYEKWKSEKRFDVKMYENIRRRRKAKKHGDLWMKITNVQFRLLTTYY